MTDHLIDIDLDFELWAPLDKNYLKESDEAHTYNLSLINMRHIVETELRENI